MLLTEYDVKKHMKLERIEAREEGREEGIKGTVRICQKLNHSKEETINSIMEEFGVNEEEAENIVKEHWNYSR